MLNRIKDKMIYLKENYKLEQYNIYNVIKEITDTTFDTTFNFIKMTYDKCNVYPYKVSPEVDNGYFLIYQQKNIIIYVQINEKNIKMWYNKRDGYMKPPVEEEYYETTIIDDETLNFMEKINE